MSSHSEQLLQKNIACKCKDGEIISVPFYLLLQSKTFVDFWGLHSFTAEQIPDDFAFSMEVVSGDVFIKVADWMSYHNGKDDPVIRMDPQTNERIPLVYNDFEKNFFDVGKAMLTGLLVASSYLCINSLYVYCTHSLAELVRGKSLEQIREMIGAVDDLSEEQKEQIRAKNIWCLY